MRAHRAAPRPPPPPASAVQGVKRLQRSVASVGQRQPRFRPKVPSSGCLLHRGGGLRRRERLLEGAGAMRMRRGRAGVVMRKSETRGRLRTELET